MHKLLCYFCIRYHDYLIISLQNMLLRLLIIDVCYSYQKLTIIANTELTGLTLGLSILFMATIRGTEIKNHSYIIIHHYNHDHHYQYKESYLITNHLDLIYQTTSIYSLFNKLLYILKSINLVQQLYCWSIFNR